MIRKSIFIIVLSVSFLFNVIFFLFAFVQKTAADKARQTAIEQRVIAEKNLELVLTSQNQSQEEIRKINEACEIRLAQLKK